jgi:hypothetical protein
MKPFTTHELQRLLAPNPGPCISLFLPTHRHHPGTAQDPIRFKNLVTTATTLLREQYTVKDVQALISPLEAVPSDDFWRYQMDGLAVFSAPDLTVYYRVPMPLPELAVVADTFHVKPLLSLLQANRHFFVLVLSQNSVAFYEGSRYSLGRVNISELPTSLAETLPIERRDAVLNLHSTAAGAPAVFHGQGTPKEENKKEDLLRFFRAIDNAIWELLREERAPLVLAGVGYYHPMYRAVSRYPYVTDQGVEGNFEQASVDDLWVKVQPLINELRRKQEEEALGEYGRLAGRGQAIDDVHAIAQAAIRGQVRQLLIAEGAHCWGRFDQANGTIVSYPTQQDVRDDDILDDLAECVLARSGEVLLMPAAQMPTGSLIAALLRW